MIINAYEALNTSTITARTVHGMSAEEWYEEGVRHTCCVKLEFHDHRWILREKLCTCNVASEAEMCPVTMNSA